jgi:hypothetical protein
VQALWSEGLGALELEGGVQAPVFKLVAATHLRLREELKWGGFAFIETELECLSGRGPSPLIWGEGRALRYELVACKEYHSSRMRTEASLSYFYLCSSAYRLPMGSRISKRPLVVSATT